MGANAQTTVPTFTASQVLTADQMNQSARTGVPVFAGTVERDAAFGGTGEKTLAEGQLCYLESTNVVQYYDGAAWNPVGASAVTFLTGATIGAVSSVSLPNDTFSSTYRNYLVVFDAEFSTNANMDIRLRASGTDNTNSTYNYAIQGVNTGPTGFTAGAATQQQWRIGFGAAATNRSGAFTLTVYAPQAAVITRFSSFGFSSDSSYNASATVQAAGVFTATTSFDALSLIAPFASGAYRVYGLADS